MIRKKINIVTKFFDLQLILRAEACGPTYPKFDQSYQRKFLFSSPNQKNQKFVLTLQKYAGI